MVYRIFGYTEIPKYVASFPPSAHPPIVQTDGINQTLNDDYNDRVEACQLLEKATSRLIRKIVLAKQKSDHAEQKRRRKAGIPTSPRTPAKAEKPVESYQMQERSSVRDLSTSVDRQASTDTGNDGEKVTNPFEDSTDQVPYEGSVTYSRHSRSRTSILEAGQLPTHTLPEASDDPERLLELFAPAKKRPRHRLGFIGMFGKKVDTIQWCKV